MRHAMSPTFHSLSLPSFRPSLFLPPSGPQVGGADLRQGHVQLAGRDSGLAPGQYAAFYRNQECLGGGVIGESSFMPFEDCHGRGLVSVGLGGAADDGELVFLDDS